MPPPSPLRTKGHIGCGRPGLTERRHAGTCTDFKSDHVARSHCAGILTGFGNGFGTVSQPLHLVAGDAAENYAARPGQRGGALWLMTFPKIWERGGGCAAAAAQGPRRDYEGACKGLHRTRDLFAVGAGNEVEHLKCSQRYGSRDLGEIHPGRRRARPVRGFELPAASRTASKSNGLDFPVSPMRTAHRAAPDHLNSV